MGQFKLLPLFIMNIISVFSGRKANIEILRKYLSKALDLKIIDQVHFWNFARNINDEAYLKSISNLKRTSSSGGGNYILIQPEISNNSFDLSVKASSNIIIKLTNTDTEYEIVLGGWHNTKSVIRENNHEIVHLNKTGVADESTYNKFTVMVMNDTLNILKNEDLLMSHKIKKNFKIQTIYFKTGHDSVGHLTFTETRNKGFYFMDTCEKSWKNYYNHYTDPAFENDVIIKSDDDIVFIDLHKLPKFIDFIKNTDQYDLVFANTINNGVSAYFQQNKFNLIPKDLMELEYPNGGLCGSLWESGPKAEVLHEYFLQNYTDFLEYNYNEEIIPVHTRFSINFFGYKGKNWYKIKDAYGRDDEHTLTVDYVVHRQFKNILYADCYVSHLSFFKQNDTGINLKKLLDGYSELYKTMEENGRFKVLMVEKI
jgi:hypothetical protein